MALLSLNGTFMTKLFATGFFLLLGAATCGNAQAQDAAKISAGEMIYSDYCSTCHGEQLRNTSGGVTFDLRRLKPEERERFVTSVNNGKNQMPPWRGVLDDNQIESIWAYIMAKGG